MPPTATVAAAPVLRPILANVDEARRLLFEAMQAAHEIGESEIRAHIDLSVTTVDDARDLINGRCAL